MADGGEINLALDGSDQLVRKKSTPEKIKQQQQGKKDHRGEINVTGGRDLYELPPATWQGEVSTSSFGGGGAGGEGGQNHFDYVDTSSSSSSSEDDSTSDGEAYEQCDCVDNHGQTTPERIPYTAIYDSQDEVHQRGYFNPSLSVDARIINVERQASGTIHLINPFIYTIELQHGKYTWTIIRRYMDFQHLHNRLLLFRAASKVSAPMRRIRRRDRNVNNNQQIEATLAYDGGKQLIEGKVGGGSGGDNNASPNPNEEIKMESLHYRGTKKPKTPTTPTAKTTIKVKTPTTPTATTPAPLSAQELAKKQGSTTTITGTSIGGQQKHRGHGHSHDHDSPRKRKPCKLPHFPMLPDSVISQERMEERKLELQRYLSAVLHIYAYRNHHETAEFLEVSRLSFVHNLGAKQKEGFIKKRPGGMRQFHGVTRFCITNCAKWSVRWLVIKDSFVCYLHPRNEQLRHVMLFDADFNVRAGPGEIEGIKKGLQISNMQRDLMLKCQNEEDAAMWKRAIEEAIRGVGKIWLQSHRFGASYPNRENSYAQWFVDGGPFMKHVADMLELAREEIFITDWWLSPEIYLKRPMVEGDRWRLDEILKRKAKQGVRIFVLLYKEVTMALGISSYYSKKTLMDKHPNIKVLRHPDHMPGTGVLLWAHHEKVIVVDQNIAFVGGIDLCYGRWDDHQHRLTDLGSVGYQAEHLVHLNPKNLASGMKSVTQMFGTLTSFEVEGLVTESDDPTQKNGATTSKLPPIMAEMAAKNAGRDEIDANAINVASTSTATLSNQEEKQPTRAARLWAKAASATGVQKRMQRGLSIPSAPSGKTLTGRRGSVGDRQSTDKKMDLADIVKKYRQLVESGVIQAEKSREDTPPTKRKRNKVAKYIHGWKEAHARRKREEQEEPVFAAEYENAWRQLQEESQIDLGLTGGGKCWMGKDYVNFIYKDFTDLDLPFHDFIDRAVTPRMPWHDIASVVYGSAARDVARHFIQRWNACKMEKVKDDDGFPFLLPKSYENVRVPRVFRQISTPCNVQILRSASLWSVGMNATEESIHQALIYMIEQAEHYIYIENQFFVSQIGGGEVHNKVAKVLLDRIVKAHRNNEQFRVYVLMPLLPGFEGELGTTGATALQVVLHWTYVSISKGPFCIWKNLESEVGDPSRYITFCSLRTHGDLVGRLVTELIYIHSKLIIVDDRRCLIGSANINDRSQLGKRDSEVGIYVDDTEFTDTTMAGKPFKTGKFSGRLRRQLFNEHLGLLENDGDKSIDIEDIASDKFFNLWKEIAVTNTDIFEKVFGCIPSDQVETFDDLSRHQHQIPLCEYNRGAAIEMLKKLRGRLVVFPSKFLIQSNLTPSITSKEGLAPAYLFT